MWFPFLFCTLPQLGLQYLGVFFVLLEMKGWYFVRKRRRKKNFNFEFPYMSVSYHKGQIDLTNYLTCRNTI